MAKGAMGDKLMTYTKGTTKPGKKGGKGGKRKGC